MKHTIDIKRAAREATGKAKITKQRQWPDYGGGKHDLGVGFRPKSSTPELVAHRKKITGKSEEL